MRLFQHRLAMALGMTVAELMGRMSHRELVDWMAFYRIEPWGDDRADLRAGIVAATVANAARGPKQKAFRPQDFMPKFDAGPAPPGDTRKEVDAQARAIFGSLLKGGKG